MHDIKNNLPNMIIFGQVEEQEILNESAAFMFCNRSYYNTFVVSSLSGGMCSWCDIAN